MSEKDDERAREALAAREERLAALRQKIQAEIAETVCPDEEKNLVTDARPQDEGKTMAELAETRRQQIAQGGHEVLDLSRRNWAEQPGTIAELDAAKQMPSPRTVTYPDGTYPDGIPINPKPYESAAARGDAASTREFMDRAFLEAIVGVCKQYRRWLGHQDTQGAFTIEDARGEGAGEDVSAEQWLRSAHRSSAP